MRWEHYNPLARYAMIADGEQIHSAMYPGSIFGNLFAAQTEINIRQHALESACFVVCARAWLDADQQAQIAKDTGSSIGHVHERVVHNHHAVEEGSQELLTTTS